MSLHELRCGMQYDVVGLLSTITQGYNRISMHGVRRILLEQQTESLGVPLRKVLIPKTCTNEIYEQLMAEENDQLKRVAISYIDYDALVLWTIFLLSKMKYVKYSLGEVG